MRAVLVASLCVGLFAGAAHAQEGCVVRDEWRAQFRGARKVSWEHLRVEERPGAPADAAAFVIDEASWTPLAEGVVRFEARTETDASGRIRRRTSTQAAPWGTVTTSVEPADAGLRYRVQVRERPALEGTLDDAWSDAVLDLLVVRGAQPPGKRTVRTLDLPGKGTEEREVEARRDGEGWCFTRKNRVETRAADGAFVRAAHPDYLGYVWLPASEADAADLDVTAPAPLEAPESTSSGSVRVTRPGRDWVLARDADGEEKVIGIEHPSGVGAFAVRLPMRLPQEERERLRFAEMLRKGINGEREKNPLHDGPALTPGAAATWNDLPAVRFEVEGTTGNEPAAGEAFLVGLGDGTLAIVVTAWPAGLAEGRAAEIERARAAIDLVDASEAPWVRRDFVHVTLELPEHWASPDAKTLHAKSPMGASQVKVSAGTMPEGITFAAAQEFWITQQRNNPNVARLEVERQEEVTVGGRNALLCVTRARLKENQGIAPEMRCASCLIDQGDGAFTEVIVVTFDLDWELGAVERVLESIRWVEEH